MKTRFRPAMSLVLVVLGGIAAGACADEEAETAAVFRAAPWSGPERYEYRVTDRGVKGEGRCTLTTAPDSSPGQTTLERRCTKDEFGDSGNSVVDSKTLTPISSERVLSDSKKQKTVTHRIAYEGSIATFTTDDGDDLRDTERDLPAASEGQSAPDWYDDESIIWMVRGLELRDGARGAYHHIINAGQPRILVVELAVAGPERVEVPAGAFDAWRVRVQRSDSSYFFWVSTQAPHQVVQAKIEDVTYALLPAQ